MRRCTVSSFVLLASSLIAVVAGACVPDFPDVVLADPAILQHAAVVTAFEAVQMTLAELYENTTRDGLSFAIVSALRCLATQC
jgi:hypothetical protein